MAAVFEDWIDSAVPVGSAGHVRRSATVITREALGPAAQVHDRMPVLLTPDDYEAWLGNSLTSGAEAVSFLQESSTKISPTLELWPVDSRVGNVRNNDPSLFVPAL
jgi:putative SOS response-associated peptidase YedK